MSLNKRPGVMKDVLPRIVLLAFFLSVACRVTDDVRIESGPHPSDATQTAWSTPASPAGPTREPTDQSPPEDLAGVGKLVLVEGSDLYRIDVYCSPLLVECVGEPMRLTEQPAIYAAPSWSPSGHEIVFASDLDPDVSEVLGVFIVGEWGGEPKPIATTGHDPDWSPNGEKVAYATWEGDGRIMLVTPEGDERAAVGRSLSSYPHWSPDATRIAFLADGVGPDSLYVLYLADQTADLVAPNAIGFMQWSPNGERIAFTAASGDKIDLFISEVGDSPGSIGEAQVVRVDGSVSYPAWSPDGTAIAFVSRDQGNSNILLASLECLNQRTPCVDNIQLITTSPDTETNPIWFPDGDHIVYTAGAGSSWRIELVDLASREAQELVGGLNSPQQLDGYSW